MKLGFYDNKLINLDLYTVPLFGEASVLKKLWTGARNKVMKGRLTYFAHDAESKLIVISNGVFAVNGEGQRPQQVQPDNVSLLANSVDWLTDETGLIDLRTKAITDRQIDQLTDSKKSLIRWLNFLLPLLATIIYGIIWYQRRRIIRKKRMEEGYV